MDPTQAKTLKPGDPVQWTGGYMPGPGTVAAVTPEGVEITWHDFKKCPVFYKWHHAASWPHIARRGR